MKKKNILISVAGVAVAGAGAAGGVAALGNLLYTRAIAPTPYDPNRTDNHPGLQAGREWARAAEGFRSLTIEASDGLVLWGAFLPAGGESHRWALCMHGWRDSHEAMGAIGRHYAEAGWNVILPDQRGHGNSQGSYIGWGYDERMDVVAWINHIIRRDPEAEIVLHGVSMGAASVLMATGGPLQEQVKAAISDCSYTSAEQLMRHTLDRHGKKALAIPLPTPFSLLYSTLRKLTLRRAGYDLNDAAPIEAVKHSNTPTLFIHGICDETVPPSMSGKLYQAARCPKHYLWMQDAAHTEAVAADPQRYWAAVDKFLRNYMEL